jgi:hypothetical protein
MSDNKEVDAAAAFKESRRRYALEAYHRRRTALIEKLGGKCVMCGSTEALAFARTDTAPASLRVNQLATMCAPKLKKALKHVRLLCGPHIKTELYRHQQITHGTWYAAYKKKCRCDECYEFMYDYNLRRQEDRRAAKQAAEAQRVQYTEEVLCPSK